MTTNIGNSNVQEFIGRAAADKANDSLELLVYVQELLPFQKGNLQATTQETVISTDDGSGYAGTLKSSNVITAYYRGDDSVSSYPPSVRKGEEVIVWCFADSSTYYWKASGRSENIRRTDKKMITVNATDDNVSEGGSSDQYGICFNTRYGSDDGSNKGIKIWTSNALGEKYRYQIDINTDAGNVSITDDDGNTFKLDSTNTRITMVNKDNSIIDLNKKDIVIACDGDITIMSKSKSISMKAKNDISSEAEEGNISFTADKANIKSEAKQNINFTAMQSITSQSTMNTDITAGTNVNIKATAVVNTNAVSILDTCMNWGLSAGGTSASAQNGNLDFKVNQFNIDKFGG